MKKRQRLLQVFLGIALSGVLTGCGSDLRNTNIEAGMKAISQMDYQTALANFDHAEASGENARLIARGRGIAGMGLTDYASAIARLEECLSYSNGLVMSIDYDVNYYLAAAYSKSGNQEKAEQIYTAILALLPEETDAFFLRGNARLELGWYEKAVGDFEEVIRLAPEDYDRLVGIYEVLDSHGYQEVGKAYLQVALDKRADKMKAYDKGRIYYYLGEYQQAYLYLEEAKTSQTADVYLYLGRSYEATGDYNYAINNVYNAYLEKQEGNADIYNQLGLCYLKQENHTAALDAFQKAMNIPNNGMMQTLQFNEIVAYEYLGEYTKAAVLLNNYLKTYPDDEQAKREYDFLSTR